MTSSSVRIIVSALRSPRATGPTRARLLRALTRASLTGADLAGADLAGANLTGANLAGAYLTRADLTRANLTRADLTGADLTGASLTGADLTGAKGLLWASVGFSMHGECGRTLLAWEHESVGHTVYECGCFHGTEEDLVYFISTRSPKKADTRTKCLHACKALIEYQKGLIP